MRQCCAGIGVRLELLSRYATVLCWDRSSFGIAKSVCDSAVLG